MISGDGWTCVCGHEIDPDSGDCIVWTPDSFPHRVPQDRSTCRCHGYDVWDIENLYERRLERAIPPDRTCVYCGTAIFGSSRGWHDERGREVCPSGRSRTTFHEVTGDG